MATRGIYPVISECEKCHTPASYLHFYGGRWLCYSNSCIPEEIERSSEKQVRDRKFVEDLRGIVRGVRPRAGGG